MIYTIDYKLHYKAIDNDKLYARGGSYMIDASCNFEALDRLEDYLMENYDFESYEVVEVKELG